MARGRRTQPPPGGSSGYEQVGARWGETLTSTIDTAIRTTYAGARGDGFSRAADECAEDRAKRIRVAARAAIALSAWTNEIDEAIGDLEREMPGATISIGLHRKGAVTDEVIAECLSGISPVQDTYDAAAFAIGGVLRAEPAGAREALIAFWSAQRGPSAARLVAAHRDADEDSFTFAARLQEAADVLEPRAAGLLARRVLGDLADFDVLRDVPGITETTIRSLVRPRLSGLESERFGPVLTRGAPEPVDEHRWMGVCRRIVRESARFSHLSADHLTDPGITDGRTVRVEVVPSAIASIERRHRDRARVVAYRTHEGPAMVGLRVAVCLDYWHEASPLSLEAVVPVALENDGLVGQHALERAADAVRELGLGQFVAQDDWIGDHPSAAGVAIEAMTARKIPDWQGDEACDHRACRWEPLPDGAGVGLSCPACGRDQLAVVPRHRIPGGHPALDLLPLREELYFARERAWGVLRGTPIHPDAEDYDALRHIEDPLSMDPATHLPALRRQRGARVASARQALRRRR